MFIRKLGFFSNTERNKTKKSKLKRGAIRCLYKIQISSLLKEWKQEVQNKITWQFDVLKWENPNPLIRGSQEVQTKNRVVKKRNTQKSGYFIVSKNKKRCSNFENGEAKKIIKMDFQCF